MPYPWWAAMRFQSRAQRVLWREGVPVFVLHKVASAPAETLNPFDYIRPDKLDTKLAALRSGGLTPTTLDAVREPRPGSFVLTFDDGYTNVFANGLEILGRHRVTAIQFLVAGRLGAYNDWDVARGEVREALMNDSQVRDWIKAGHEIGSHSLTHADLKRLSVDAAREEIVGSKRLLEDRFGTRIRHFSYPSGRLTPQVKDMVREAGYETGCGMEFGVNSASQCQFDLRRISPLDSRELLAKILHRVGRRLVRQTSCYRSRRVRSCGWRRA